MAEWSFAYVDIITERFVKHSDYCCSISAGLMSILNNNKNVIKCYNLC